MNMGNVHNITTLDHETHENINLPAVWRSIYYRKWSILSLTLLVATLSILLAYKMPSIYRASSTLLIENKSANVVSIEQVYGEEGSSSEYLQTQFELIKSRALAERVVRELGLDMHPEFDLRQQQEPLINWQNWLNNIQMLVSPADMEAEQAPAESEIFDAVVRAFRGRITVSPQGQTQLVEVSVDMADATTAARAANALAQGYIESQLEAKLQMTQTATSWMNQQMGGLKSKLEDSERRLQAFMEKENLVNIGGITTVSAGELSNTGERLTDARRERNAAESQYRQVAAMKGAGYRRLASVPAVMSDSVVAQFKAAEATASAKVQELSRRYGPMHPAMVAAQTELNAARTSLRAQVEQVVASIENSYQLAMANERGLQSTFEKNKEQIQNINRNEFRLRELQREVDTNRALYDTFMTRLKEAAATQDLETVSARIVDYALVPTEPVKPKKSLIVALATLIALILGSGIAILLEMLNNTFKSTDEVESVLNLPVIGVLPLLKEKKGECLARFFSSSKNDTFNEAVRTIRTGLVLSGLTNPNKVIVITSSVPGEGKSMVSSNLAAALGAMEKVLLVDADMRRPTLAKCYGFSAGTPGLANLIAGSASVEECILKADGIEIMPAGTVPPNPLELLSSERFKEIMKDLAEKYDRVIIDSSPIQAVSDALVLCQYSNTVIYVVKYESTVIPLVQTGVGKLLQMNVPIKGVIFNQVDLKKCAKYGDSHMGYYEYPEYSKPHSEG